MAASIEIFRTGRHTDMNGSVGDFDAATLQSIAKNYDPALHEAPLVVGHPETDAPAYGWVSGVTMEGDRLVVNPSQLDPAFADLVKQGRYKKVSASFYTPNSPANPKPGQFYLRHVGFLGAQPPAIKGLRDARFSEGAFVTFNEESTTMPPEPTPAPDLAAKDQEIAALKAEVAKQKAAFAESTTTLEQTVRESRLRGLREFAERMEREGKILPRQRGEVVAFMDALHAGGVVSYAEEGGATKSVPASQWFQEFLQHLPSQVIYGEISPNSSAGAPGYTPPAGYTVDPDSAALHNKALAYQEQNKTADYMAAVMAVGGR